ncbi:hypothetical protein KM043_000861 [Ampulex compressa]|nr:hypothetical protein KM043_000861 [Ampulex compressa]
MTGASWPRGGRETRDSQKRPEAPAQAPVGGPAEEGSSGPDTSFRAGSRREERDRPGAGCPVSQREDPMCACRMIDLTPTPRATPPRVSAASPDLPFSSPPLRTFRRYPALFRVPSPERCLGDPFVLLPSSSLPLEDPSHPPRTRGAFMELRLRAGLLFLRPRQIDRRCVRYGTRL